MTLRCQGVTEQTWPHQFRHSTWRLSARFFNATNVARELAVGEPPDVTVDTTARVGWRVPDWYTDLKAHATSLLGSVEGMRRAACAAAIGEGG